MRNLLHRLWHQDDGVVMLVVISFLALSIPVLTATLSLASTVNRDSAVKTSILKDHYAAQGCTQYAYYRVSKETGYLQSLSLGVPDVFNFNGCSITVTKVSEDAPLVVTIGDVVFALDNSGSVDSDELDDLKEAAVNIVHHFNPGMATQDIRIGVSRFRGSSASVVGMTDIDILGHGGFVYVDDPFRGTSQPDYADGEWGSSSGQTGGGLEVELGGVDDSDITNMSGGWQKNFNLATAEEVELSFSYNLTLDSDYDSDEYGEVIVTVGAQQPGTGGNDYVARIYDGGTTGWQTFQTNLGTLSAGAHTLTIGGFNNKKTTTSESMTVEIDDVQITVNCSVTDCPPFINSSFDTDAEGSSYADDTFRSTSAPSYATGTWDAAGGQTGGGLSVTLGGIDDADIYGMSGGWQRNFNLGAATQVELSFAYNMVQAANYESDEHSEVIVTVDALQPGTGGNDYVARISGNGNGGSAQTTGWQTFTVDLGTLSAGAHTLTIGGYNSKKTYNDETTEVYVDDVVMAPTCNTYCSPLMDEDFTGNTPIRDGINGLVQGAPDLSSGTNLVAGINGGAAQFNTGLGDRISPPAPNVMIVITDGEDTWGNSATDITNASTASGAEVFAIGVGTSISMPTLNAIASDPDVDHVFTVSDYSGLLAIIDAVVAALNGALGTGTLVTITSVSPDGTISEYEVLIPNP